MTALPQTVSMPGDDHIRVGVGVLLVNELDQILLGLRKSKHGQGTWSPPGGHVEFGENHKVAAIREVLEETGIDIPDVKLFEVTSDTYPDNGRHYITVVLLSRISSQTVFRITEPDKWEKWQWFAPEYLPMNLFLSVANLWHQIGGADGFRARLAQIS